MLQAPGKGRASPHCRRGTTEEKSGKRSEGVRLPRPDLGGPWASRIFKCQGADSSGRGCRKPSVGQAPTASFCTSLRCCVGVGPLCFWVCFDPLSEGRTADFSDWRACRRGLDLGSAVQIFWDKNGHFLLLHCASHCIAVRKYTTLPPVLSSPNWPFFAPNRPESGVFGEILRFGVVILSILAQPQHRPLVSDPLAGAQDLLCHPLRHLGDDGPQAALVCG